MIVVLEMDPPRDELIVTSLWRYPENPKIFGGALIPAYLDTAGFIPELFEVIALAVACFCCEKLLTGLIPTVSGVNKAVIVDIGLLNIQNLGIYSL